jgi:hypothetical protein
MTLFVISFLTREKHIQGLVFRFQAARYHLPDRPEEASDVLDSALKHSVLSNCAESAEDVVASGPGCELGFNRADDVLELVEVAIV